MIVSERMHDMLERYGEVCPQIKAAQILSVSPRTIMRMADDGRLRRVGSHIDVRLYLITFDPDDQTKLPLISKLQSAGVEVCYVTPVQV